MSPRVILTETVADQRPNDPLYVVADEDLFDSLERVHKSMGHKAIVLMRKSVGEKYCNIPEPVIKVE